MVAERKMNRGNAKSFGMKTTSIEMLGRGRLREVSKERFGFCDVRFDFDNGKDLN